MMRLSAFGAVAVLGLVLSLAIFTTGAFALDNSQAAGQDSHISVSAHVAAMQAVLRGTAGQILNGALRAPKVAQNNCGNGGWGNGCGFQGCGSHCFHPILTTHCAERECHSVQVCHWSHWGRVCRGERICRFRSVSRRFVSHIWDGGWNRAWGAKQH